MRAGIADRAARGFGIGSANGTPYGALTGEHADATDPCDYHNRFFELAETNYPGLFPESLFVPTRLTPASFYRHYSSTGVFLGIANDVAFASGGPYPGTGSQGAGFILQLDLGASTGTALQMRMLSDKACCSAH